MDASTVSALRRGGRNLALSVFNPDLSSDDENTSKSRPKPLPNPHPLPKPPFSANPSSISITTSGNVMHNGSRAMSPSTRPNYYGYIDSPSSRSSPAPDTTPSPSTPSSSAPPINIPGEDKGRLIDGLGLSVVDQSDSELHNPSQTRQPSSQQDVRHPYALSPAQQRSHSTNPSLTQLTSSSVDTLRRGSFDRTIITATADAENHVIVDITGARDAAFIRERIFSKLHIPDEEQPYFSIYRTELGELALGDAVTDDQLMIYCEAFADGRGTLKFLVQRTAVQSSHSKTGSAIIPPHSPPIPVPPTPQQYSAPFLKSTRPGTRSAGEGSLSSANGDRMPWERASNGYDASASEDYDTRGRYYGGSSGRREHSLSSSDSRSLTSPTSPTTSNLSVAPLISGHEARKGNVTPTPYYVMSQNHRRERSEAAAVEREQALEATERYRENQTKEYDAQMRRIKQKQRMGQTNDREMQPNIPGRSESADSGPPPGWVLVNPVVQTPNQPYPSTSGSNSNNPRAEPWGSTSRLDPWSRNSPPADSRQGFTQTQPAGRPYPHSTGPSQPYPSPLQPAFNRQATPSGGASLSRSPNIPASAASKYISSSSSRGQPMGPPPGASDPRMAQFDSRNPTPPSSQFYPIPTSTPPYNYPPPSRSAQQRLSPPEAPRLTSARSIPELRAVRPTQSQLPVGSRRPPQSPQSLLPEKSYGPPITSSRNPPLPPNSPHRLPPASPGRPIFTLGAYAVPAQSSKNATTDQGQSRSGMSSGHLLSSGVFVDGPLARKPGRTPVAGAGTGQSSQYTLRTNQSSDRLSPLNPVVGATASSLPTNNTPAVASSNPRYGFQLSDSATPADALNRLEGAPGFKSSPSSSQGRASPLDMPALPQSSPAIVSPGPPEGNVGVGASISPLSGEASPSPSTTSTPSTSSTVRGGYDHEDEGTLKTSDRDYYLSLLNLSATDGTVMPHNKPGQPKTPRGGTLKRRQRPPSVRKTDVGRAAYSEPERMDDFDDDEDYYSEEDDDDANFWQPSYKTPQATPNEKLVPILAPTAPLSITPNNRRDSELQRARGPTLKVQIDAASHEHLSVPSPGPTPLNHAPSDRHLAPENQANSGTMTPISRRTSFRRDTWAFRPPAEDVYDRLQDFFPNHDLDKTFVDTTVPSGSSSPIATEPTPAPTPTTPSSKFRHRKSIRYVAEEGKRALERQKTVKAPANTATNIARKRSTKLWGLKVEEVTPGQKSGPPSSIPESPTNAPAKATIKWVKGELIGKGTYGRVYLALNATTGEMLAVKQVEMPQTVSDQEDVRQIAMINALKAERETLETLDHPNVVQYLGFEQTKEFFSVFLEYVPGGSVGRCLQKHGKFDPEVIKSFTSQMLDGLAYLHSRKIIHRDMKAENILVDPSGVCKISDFGISKRSDEIYNNAAMTAMQGSLFWMAPEMIHNNKKGYNAKIDIWSLGCVFLEMWAGRRPWEQDDFVVVMFKVGVSKMVPPVPDDVHLDEDADDFRLKCFATNPDERPTAEELRFHHWLTLRPGWQFTGFK